MNRRISRVSTLALFTLPLSMIGIAIGGRVPAEGQQPIRIGATMSQTGTLATQGVPANNGYLLCQKDVTPKAASWDERLRS